MAFLYILIEWQVDGFLSRLGYRKSTNTDLYLHKESHHHPVQNRGEIMTLLDRAHWIAYNDHIVEEWQHLQRFFQENGFTGAEIDRTFKCFDYKRQRAQTRKEQEPIVGVAVVPYFQTGTNSLTRLLHHKNIRVTSFPL